MARLAATGRWQCKPGCHSVPAICWRAAKRSDDKSLEAVGSAPHWRPRSAAANYWGKLGAGISWSAATRSSWGGCSMLPDSQSAWKFSLYPVPFGEPPTGSLWTVIHYSFALLTGLYIIRSIN